jgi:alpha-tubulin suppressor-like RCC1 family protein
VEQPQQLHGGFKFSSIAAGGHITCGIMTAGGSRCIGMTQLTNSSNGRAQSLLEIPGEGDHPFVAISGGAFHTCAIDRQGGAWCWGEQRFGAVGAGDSATESEPLQIRVER